MHEDRLAGVQQRHEEQLAEAQMRTEERVAQADGRLQAVKQDMLERHGVLERRLRDSEEAVGTQKATHEKALSKLIAQQARKVRPWLSCIMLSAWR